MESTAFKQGKSPRVSGLLASLDLIAKASAQLLHPSSDLESILPAILEMAKSLVAADAYAVWRAYPDGTWGILASSGLSEQYRAHRIFTPPQEIPRTTIAIPDVLNEQLVEARRQMYLAERISSLLVAPLLSTDKVIGTVTFYFRNEHHSSEDEIHLATALANLTASAITTSSLHEQQSRIRRQSEFLADASSVLASSMDYEVTLSTVTQLAVPHVADWCAIDLYDDGKLHRVGIAHADPTKLDLAREYRELYPPDLSANSGVGSVVRTGQLQFFPHVTDEMLLANSKDERHRWYLQELGIQSFIIAPLKVRERVLGALTLVTADRDLDITECRLAEDLARRAAVAIENSRLFSALEESERKFRTVADTVPCAIYIHDGNRLIYVNPAAEELSGYTQSELATMGMFDLIHPDHREMVAQRAAARLRGEPTPSRYEFKGVRKDGSVVWLDFAGAIVDFEGRPAMLATAFDITERKLAQQRLERSEKEARSLLENLPDVVARYDRDLRYLYMSPVVERLTGIPAREFIGKRHSETGLPADLCRLFDRSLRTIFSTGKPDNIEFSSVGADGQTRYLVGIGIPLFDPAGEVEHVLTITHDMTAFRKAEEAVARNEKELLLLTDILPALVAYIDADEKFQRVNQTYEQWFGKPKADVVGRTIREIMGSNYQRLESHIRDVLCGEVVQYEATNDYPDKRRHVLITYVPDFDDEHRVRGFAALIQDITDRRAAEEALRKTEKLAAVGRLAASISHEINNPLESVTNLVFLARNAPEIAPRTREFLNIAERELGRVSQIASQTLRFYRQSSRPSQINLAEVLDAVLSVYEGRISNSQIQVRREYADGEYLIAGLDGELRQVFANLIGNAIDASPPGGRIRLRIASGRAPDGSHEMRVIVADNGSGISPELRSRIFEPFFTTKTNTGTGLGLWITREILGKHGGRIRVRSSQTPGGTGTVFMVCLPVEFPEAAAAV